MFVSETHQPQLLAAQDYHSADQYDREKESILSGAWHCVGSMDDLRQDGDFFTIDLLGHPLLVRRDEERVRAYLNVCSHRFCKLTSCDKGNAPTIKCQYHGWHYSANGQTSRIPDAKSFKPLKKGGLGLVVYHCQTVGSMVFVNLTEETSSPSKTLLKQLGEKSQWIEDWFDDRWQLMMSYSDVFDCNWKTYLENGLESYHINTVHKDTLFHWPTEDECEHELEDHATCFISSQEAPTPSARRLDRWLNRTLSLDQTPYHHVHLYPTLTFIRMSMFSYFESVIPISATKTRVITRGYCYRGADPTLTARVLNVFLRRWGSRFLKRIQDEDVGILKLNQSGMQSPAHPRGGLISSREERIVHFQNFIHESTRVSNENQQHD